MSRFPALRGKTHVRFSNPLAGKVYDNNNYQSCCFFQEDHPGQQLDPQKSRSLANYSKKEVPQHNYFGLHAEMKSESMIKTSKIADLRRGMVNLYSKRCAKNHSPSSEKNNPQGPAENVAKRDSASNSPSFFKTRPKKFQQIELTLLELFSETPALVTGQGSPKKFKINLARYFNLFFKDKAVGVVSEQLSDFVQRYSDDLIAEEENYTRQTNDERFNISTKRALYEKLLELHRCGHKQQLKELLKYYCLPSRETRHIFLQDLLSLITRTLHRQFNISLHNRYCLLDQRGEKITDFAHIKFTTKQLFVAQEDQLEPLFRQHFSHMQLQQAAHQKHSFRQTLKNHFRKEVTRGLYQENLAVNQSFTQERVEKRSNLNRAQRIINLKNSKINDGRRRFKERLEMERNSPNRNNEDLKRQARPNPSDRYVSKEQRLIAEFKRLKLANDYEDADFKNDQGNRNKIQFSLMAKESPYFKSKTQAQIKKIFQSLTFSEPHPSQSQQLVTLQDYISLRKIIACWAQRQCIISFVERYLCFDEYGQLHKQRLKQTLALVIGESKTSEVILLTIWGWLQKNGVISSDVLSRTNMQLLYQRNKIVYFLLISLIFGTNQTTVLELAEQILI